MQMELDRISSTQSDLHSSLQGDPATYTFALFLIGALAIITVGAVVGIAAGNIAHYEYFGPNNSTTISSNDLWNVSIFQKSFSARSSRLWLAFNERSERSNSFQRTEDT
ncbi:hypothetical protein I4U23_024897 [Adineta vaga]|nr:hypothetical protein I4U23_024897 [Adineta vaga]